MCVAQAGDSLVLLVPYEDELALFGPPLGEISIPEAIDAVEKTTGNRIIACGRLPEDAIQQISTVPGWEPFEDRNNFDYVYRREDLANLSGRKYHNKRNLIAQCLNENDCTYESYSPEIIPDLQKMQSRWCKARDCGKTPGLCHEYLAINEMFQHGGEFDLAGGVVKIDGVIQAYAMGSKLNDNTAAIHFEKAMPEFKGLYQLINQWICQHEFQEFEFINREQDLGIEGLRKAKESYFPEHMITKFIALNGLSLEEYMKNRIRALRCPPPEESLK